MQILFCSFNSFHQYLLTEHYMSGKEQWGDSRNKFLLSWAYILNLGDRQTSKYNMNTKCGDSVP